MLKKESKIRILENFISLDYLLLGKTIHEMNVPLELAQQYIELKGALSSAMIEMYELIEHSPKEITDIITESDIRQNAMKNAIQARKNVKHLLTSDDGKANIISTVFEAVKLSENEQVDEIVNFTIQEKALQLGIDNMLIARSIQESKCIEKLNDFDGRLLEDTYKALRNSLIETALEILEIHHKNKSKEN